VRLKLHRVGVSIQDQVATTHVVQTFVNESTMPVEGTYLFPLPESAAISEFNMIVDGQKIEGQILGKQEARRVYEDIVRRMRDPALLEYVGRDLFQARLFPIPPGDERQIELTYDQILTKEDGLVHYQYPIGVDSFVAAQRTGLARRQATDQLAISVKISSSTPLKAIYSPSHDIVVAREGDFQALVGYEETQVVPSADFDLYFSLDEGDIGVNLLSFKPGDDDGYFLLLAAPNVEVESSEIVARDVILVLDISGSMQGQKMEQARNALLTILERLNPQDRFNIVSFSTGIRQFARDLQAKDQVAAARAFVSGLEAGGGTDINRALLEALAQAEEGRPTVIIFLTDGLPTEGEVNPQNIVTNVRRDAGANVQVFAFGVGDDVNTVLLDSISQENRGTSAYVRPGQPIDEIVTGFYAKVATPVLADLSLDFGDVFAEDIYPYPLPDLFAGEQLILTGRYRSGGPAQLTLSGMVNGRPRSFVFEDLSWRTEGGEAFIARLWATRKIGHLLNEIRLRGRNPELVDEVIRLSTRYGVASPYTSFFVPEPESAMSSVPLEVWGTPMPVPRAAATVVVMDKEMQAQAEAALSAAAEAPAAGAAAVEESQAREALRSADTVAAAGGEERGLRHALDKAFAYRSGLWVDTTYSGDLPRMEVAFGSEEYFAILEEHPEWSAYWAVSPNLIVVLDGTAYVITDSGEVLATEPQTSSVEAVPVQATPTAIPGQLSQTYTPTVATGAETPSEVAVVQPDSPAQPISSPALLCTAPALALGLMIGPGLWARRMRRRD
jgi:Ca-activated chloride channel family protein